MELGLYKMLKPGQHCVHIEAKIQSKGVTELVYIVYTMSHAKYFHL